MNSGVFMMSLLKRKSKEIKPYTPVERPPCPFHGFSAMSGGVMMDSEGNQCALETKSYHPCGMKTAGDKPYWSDCPFNTEENRKKLQGDLEKVRVFPREFRPQKAKWDGILLKDWMIYMAKE